MFITRPKVIKLICIFISTCLNDTWNQAEVTLIVGGFLLLSSFSQSALLLTEVLKEREAQVELKRRIREASHDTDKEIMATLKRQDEKALQQEMEREQRRKQDFEATVQGLMQQ